MNAKYHLLTRSDLHIARKLWHMMTGLTGLGIYITFNIDAYNMGIGLVAFAFVSFLIDISRLKVKKINTFMLKYMSIFMRESEKKSLTGLPFYALGAGASLLLYKEPFAILSILFLIFSDPISSAFGIMFGTQKIYGNKSLEGSLAGYICCFSLVMIYGLNFFTLDINLFVFAALSALASVVAELFSTKIDDNLMIPVASGLAMTIINLVAVVH